MNLYSRLLTCFALILLPFFGMAQKADSVNVRGLKRSYELKDEITFKVKDDTSISVNVMIGLERYSGGEWVSIADNLWQDNDLGSTFIVILNPGEAREQSWEPSKMRVIVHKKGRNGSIKESREKLKKGRYRFVMKWGTSVTNMDYVNHSSSFALK